MEVLVTGGNGFVGRHLVAALLERVDRVRVLALPNEDVSGLDEGVSVHRGDICRVDSLVDPMRGVQRVVHLAAMSDVWRPMAQYAAVNVTGTENVCRAALAAGVDRLVHMSSSSVYGMGHGRPVSEDAPLQPFADPYPVTKADADRLVQRMAVEDGLPAVIIRPDQIFGPGDHVHFGRMADRLRTGRGIIVGPGHNTVPFVFVSDAVQGLMLALDHPHAVGRAYNITSDAPLTQRQLFETIAAEIGARPPRVHVPYRVLYAAAYATERLIALTGAARRPPLSRVGVAFIGTDNLHAIDRARRELAYAPRVPLRDGIRLASVWYLRSSAVTGSAGTPTRAAGQVS